jgi:large subunit ribosomal protein L15e
MGLYKHLKELWKKPKENLGPLMQERLIKWRKEPSTIRIERPTRLDRARNLGYRAKEGIIVVRQRIPRGGKRRPKFGKRRPKRSGQKLILGKSYQAMAETRAAKKYTNLEVLNSYPVAKDGKYSWYEIIMIDWSKPTIIKDPKLKWVLGQSGRAFRGLTSAGRKSRGLRNKGKGAEKLRPSRSANVRKRLAKK